MQQDIDKTNVCLFPFTLQISHTLILDFDTNLGDPQYGQLQNFHH